uniref:Uncharacterized protein n=1 Tax=Strongyloides papillosus TaxID=174720 RepID=A0A0N5BBV1_STREA
MSSNNDKILRYQLHRLENIDSYSPFAPKIKVTSNRIPKRKTIISILWVLMGLSFKSRHFFCI